MVSGSEGQDALEQFQISVIALCECLGQAWKQKEFSLLSVSEKLNRQTQSYLRYSDYPLASHPIYFLQCYIMKHALLCLNFK